MNKEMLREIIDIADTVALVALCGVDSAGQLELEIQRATYTFGLTDSLLSQFKAQVMTRLQNKYNIRG